jgi:hypothetical protein
MIKAIKLILITIFIIIPFQSSASLMKVSVDFEAINFSDLFGTQQFPFSSISGSTDFLIDLSNNNSGIYISEVTPSFIDLNIDGKIWEPTETLISYIYQGDLLTHFTFGGVINSLDSPFGITGTENDFTIDFQGSGSASVALQRLGTIFNSQSLTLNTKTTLVSEPTTLFLFGLPCLFFIRKRLNKGLTSR